MPPPETFERNQRAVLWAAAGYDDYGRITVTAPVEIKVRWNTNQSQMAGPQGSPITIDATVVVAQEVEVGSLLWLGRLSEWYGTGSDGDDTQLMIVATSHRTPDLKNRYVRRELGLQFYEDQLPTLAT